MKELIASHNWLFLFCVNFTNMINSVVDNNNRIYFDNFIKNKEYSYNLYNNSVYSVLELQSKNDCYINKIILSFEYVPIIDNNDRFALYEHRMVRPEVLLNIQGDNMQFVRRIEDAKTIKKFFEILDVTKNNFFSKNILTTVS